ncbi:hypothetical protein ACTQ6A_02165 [Lachnospiraceae bacterium LCP25S3_G4]
MEKIGIVLYVMAAALFIGGIVQFIKAKKSQKFGKLTTASVQECHTTGFGPIRKYWVTLIYKAEGRKYKRKLHTNFLQILNNGDKIPIGYNPEDPEDILVRGNDAYKVFFLLAAGIVIITNILTFIV